MTARLFEWLFLAGAVREARAVQLAADDVGGAAFRQAKLLVEVARRVTEPALALPAGNRSALLVGLYRDAVWWALAAGRPAGEAAPPDLAGLWRAEPGRLLSAGKDAATVEAARGILVERGGPSLDVSEADAQRARAFAEALVSELDAPSRRLDGVLARRLIRFVSMGVVLVALVVAGRALWLGSDLAAGRPVRTSSSWSGCAADPTCRGLLFHSNPELEPWAEVDLGAGRSIHRVEVTNRGDCCGERAVPLVVETSNDRVRWTEVARREAEFSTWAATFPRQTARFVRLRVARHSTFHLEALAVR